MNIYYFYVYRYVVCSYICAAPVCSAHGGQRGRWILWDWSHHHVVLGAKPGSSSRTASAFNHEPSLQPQGFLFTRVLACICILLTFETIALCNTS